MESRTAARIALILCLLCFSGRPTDGRDDEKPVKPPAAMEDNIAVFFCPDGGALDAIVAQIDAARTSVDVQAYLLTTSQLAKPLAEAHGRGVKVRIVLDKENAGDKYSSATYFANAGIPVWLDDKHKEAHNKVMLIDGHTIITGSMNFTLAAEEENAENLLILHDKPKLYAAYSDNFETHLKHAKKYATPR